jgi:hypothetical protein
MVLFFLLEPCFIIMKQDEDQPRRRGGAVLALHGRLLPGARRRPRRDGKGRYYQPSWFIISQPEYERDRAGRLLLRRLLMNHRQGWIHFEEESAATTVQGGRHNPTLFCRLSVFSGGVSSRIDVHPHPGFIRA